VGAIEKRKTEVRYEQGLRPGPARRSTAFSIVPTDQEPGTGYLVRKVSPCVQNLEKKMQLLDCYSSSCFLKKID